MLCVFMQRSLSARDCIVRTNTVGSFVAQEYSFANSANDFDDFVRKVQIRVKTAEQRLVH